MRCCKLKRFLHFIFFSIKALRLLKNVVNLYVQTAIAEAPVWG